MIEIKRSKQPRINFSYKDADIKEAIGKDFYHLCYICEKYDRDFEIDHFKPKGENKNLTNNWDNLFCICQKCNKKRPKKVRQENDILNCCKDKVESLINLKYDNGIIKVSTTSTEQKAKNTVSFLNYIYNGITTVKKSHRTPTARQEEIGKTLENFGMFHILFTLLKIEKCKVYFCYMKYAERRLTKPL